MNDPQIIDVARWFWPLAIPVFSLLCAAFLIRCLIGLAPPSRHTSPRSHRRC